MRFLLALACCLFFADPAVAEDWPVWRGPTGRNIASPGQNLPKMISEKQGILWKVPVPGRGHSSPIVVGDLVILTTEEEKKETQSVIAFDRLTGQQKWQTLINTGGLATMYKTNTHASSTVASNGEFLFALFENHLRMQLVKLSMQGAILNQIDAGPYAPDRYQFGIGLSPLLYQSLVIVAMEYEAGSLVAFDQDSGKEVWRIPRRTVSFSSPIVAHLNGRDQLLISGDNQVQSYDPLTGASLWTVTGAAQVTCGTIVWENDIIFASGGYPEMDTVAIRVGPQPKILWRHPEKCYEQSLLASQGYVYAVNETGICFCWRAEDGKVMWKTRLCGKTSASPVLADGIIYQIDEFGRFVAFRDSHEKFQKVFDTRLGDEGYATPTICGGRMYCRVADSKSDSRQETLYCFGIP